MAPLKISAKVEVDASQAVTGSQQAASAIGGIGDSSTVATTKLQRLIETSTGLHSGAANQNLREWRGALADEGLALDRLRAKYNPVFAVIQQYKSALTEIRTANAQGALGIDEMTAAISRQRQAALANIAVLKGLHQPPGRPSGTFGNQSNPANVGYQLFDIFQTAPFLSAPMVGLQQGPQLAQALGGQSIKGAFATLAAGFATIANPLSLTTIGLTAVTAAAIHFGAGLLLAEKDVRKLEDVLKDHEDLLKKLEERYGSLVKAAKGYGAESTGILAFNTSSDLRSLTTATNAAQYDLFGSVGTVLRRARGGTAGGADLKVDGDFAPFEEALKRLRAEAKLGKPDFEAFYDSIYRIAQLDPEYAKQADELAKLVAEYRQATKALEDLERIRRALFNDRGANGMLLSQGTTNRSDMGEYALFLSRQAVAARRAQEALDAQLAGLAARSPAEKADAARRSEAARYDDSETPQQRRQRIEAAGTLAQTQAEKALKDAQDERKRSLDQTLAGQQLEISLIGKTTSEQERLRMEFRLINELKEEARKNNIPVDQAELALIKQKAAEYGKLAELQKAQTILRSQDDTLTGLRQEIGLLGQSEAAQSRIRAVFEAQKTLRDQGIDQESAIGRQIQRNAALAADVTTELKRQQAAWSDVQEVGKNAIDSIFGAISDGDLESAFDGILKDLQKNLLSLGGANPLKNALYGSNLPTLSDAGGVSGFFSKLLGGGLDTSSMAVTAGTVMINGGVSAAGGLLSSGLGAANQNGTTSLGGSADIQSQVWNFFAGKTVNGQKLKDFQIAAILGHANAESAFNPTAAGDGGKALGLFQWNDRAPALLDALGGRQNLGDVNGQLNFAWKELLGSENGALKALLNSTDLKSAVGAFGGFERPRGWSAANPFGMDNASGRYASAAAALEQFTSKTGTATQGLGTLGSGLGSFGNALTNIGSNTTSGGGIGGLLSSLFGFGTSQWTQAASGAITGLFDTGGYTGPGGVHQIAGLAHKGEVIWSQQDVARAGGPAVVEAMRLGKGGYAKGGVGGMTVAPIYSGRAAKGNAVGRGETGISIAINNYAQADVQAEETTDERGGRQISFVISDQVGSALSKKGGGARNVLEKSYGVKPRGTVR
ncbi:phage tail tip lysozyme [Rhizobium halophytocola]|uniref:Phage tail lysozyme domain-containing protein n=1 Tax=Rhizobium halophytocola TaxID=735519 RepID=A0ABS4E418_9HYPH|nr:phage tail tip lysozyme [Rhizobium halophytocola]MBP1852682.1 hypothetical protein [Rhizobium halophytocola]